MKFVLWKHYRWVILFIGVLSQITFAIGFAGIPASAIIMRNSYKFSMEQLGLVLGCMGLGVALSEIIWGILTDKLGDKIVLIAGLVLMGITYLIISLLFTPIYDLIPKYWSLGGLLIIAGAVGGSINSSSGRAVMTWFQENERGFAMSIRQTAIPIGAAFGVLLIPYTSLNYGYKISFIILSIICFIASLCAYIFMSELKSEVSKNIKTENQTNLFKNKKIWKIALAGGALTFPQMAILSFSSIFLSDKYHLDIIITSYISFIIQLGGGCLRIIAGKVSDKYKNRKKIISLIAIVAGIAALTIGLIPVQNSYFIIFLLIILGLFGNAWHGIGYTEIAISSGSQYAGRALGVMGTTVFTTSFLVTFIIPFIIKYLSWNSVWVITGVISLLAVPLIKEKK